MCVGDKDKNTLSIQSLSLVTSIVDDSDSEPVDQLDHVEQAHAQAQGQDAAKGGQNVVLAGLGLSTIHSN